MKGWLGALMGRMPEGFRAFRRIWWVEQHHVSSEQADKGLGLEVRGFQSQELGLLEHSSGSKRQSLAAGQCCRWENEKDLDEAVLQELILGHFAGCPTLSSSPGVRIIRIDGRESLCIG
jgi:hypothetical protein